MVNKDYQKETFNWAFYRLFCFASLYTLMLYFKMLLNSTPCFRKKTPTHIIGYKLWSSCLFLIIFDTKIPHII